MEPGNVRRRRARSHGLAAVSDERQYHVGGLNNLGGRRDRHLQRNTMSSEQTAGGRVMSCPAAVLSHAHHMSWQ